MPTYVIKTPPSANKLFYNVRGKGRRKSHQYRKWIDGELKALLAQRAKPVEGRASVSITIPNGTRGDCDNRIKPLVDLLVRAGILKDDSGKYVASVSMSFGDVQFAHIAVEPMRTA